MPRSEVAEDLAFAQAERILTDRFGNRPIAAPFLKGISCLHISWVPQGPLLADEDAWRRDMVYVWATMSRTLADSRCGVSMWRPFWALEHRHLGPTSILSLMVLTEPDPVKIADAIARATPGHADARFE